MRYCVRRLSRWSYLPNKCKMYTRIRVPVGAVIQYVFAQLKAYFCSSLTELIQHESFNVCTLVWRLTLIKFPAKGQNVIENETWWVLSSHIRILNSRILNAPLLWLCLMLNTVSVHLLSEHIPLVIPLGHLCPLKRQHMWHSAFLIQISEWGSP